MGDDVVHLAGDPRTFLSTRVIVAQSSFCCCKSRPLAQRRDQFALRPKIHADSNDHRSERERIPRTKP